MTDPVSMSTELAQAEARVEAHSAKLKRSSAFGISRSRRSCSSSD